VHLHSLRIASLALPLVLLIVCGCGGTSAPPATFTLAATASTTVDPTNSVTLNATSSTGTTGLGVSWALSGTGCTGATCGSLTTVSNASATYVAPAVVTSALSVTVTATSVQDTSISTSIALTVPPNPSITTAAGALAAGGVGTPYSATLAGTGGVPPYTWSEVNGNLPPGLSLNQATGVLSGTPTGAVNSTFTVQLRDSGSPSLTATAGYTLAITAPAITITTTSMPAATLNNAYSATVAATGGVGALTYSIAAGALPAGLTLSSAGAITGTPTVAGTAVFTVQATDSYNDYGSAKLSITVSYPMLSITTTSLPNATDGEQYTQMLNATGGSGTGYSWSITSGTLPTGLTLSSLGNLMGKPMAATTSPISFTVQVEDSANNLASATLMLTVNNYLQITTVALLPGTVSTAYSTTLKATGGAGSYTWILATGTPNPGLSLSASGQITGAPTSVGVYTFQVQVKDAGGESAFASYGLVVNSATLPSCTHDGSGNGVLSGTYGMLLTGFDPAGLPYDMAGAFTADGAGNVTSGMADVNGLSFVNSHGGAVQTEQNYTFSGSYSIGGTDHRGMATWTNTGAAASGLPPTSTFCFSTEAITGGVAQSGRIILADGSGYVLTGFFQIRTGTVNTATLSSGYAFGFQGSSAGGPQPVRQAGIGQVVFNGSGGINGGQLDFANYDSATQSTQYNAQVPLLTTAANSAIGYTMGATGRGTITLGITQGSNTATVTFIAYAVGAGNKLLLLSTDASNALLAGQAIQQANITYSQSGFTGSSVYHKFHTTSVTAPVYDDIRVGQYTFNGAGGVNEVRDQNSGGMVSLDLTRTGTYTVSSSGYLTISGLNTNTPNFYLYGPGSGFGLDGALGIGFYTMLGQTVPSGGFSASALAGTSFALGTVSPLAYNINPTHNYPQTESGTLQFGSGGMLTGTTDTVQAPGSSEDMTLDSTISGPTYGVEPTTGRIAISIGSTPFVVGYMISPTEATLIQVQNTAGWDGDSFDLFQQ